MPDELNGIAFLAISDLVKNRSVYVSEWEVHKQIAECLDAEFLLEQYPTYGPYTFQVFDRTLQQSAFISHRSEDMFYVVFVPLFASLMT
jgi:hypothetical protein